MSARQTVFCADLRMRTEYNIARKQKLSALCDRRVDQLEEKDAEIEKLKAEVSRLHTEVSS